MLLLYHSLLAAKSGDASVVPVPPAAAAGARLPALYPATRGVSGNKGRALSCVACHAAAVHQRGVGVPTSGMTCSVTALCTAAPGGPGKQGAVALGCWASGLQSRDPHGCVDRPVSHQPCLSLLLPVSSPAPWVRGPGRSPWSSFPSWRCAGAVGELSWDRLHQKSFPGGGEKRPKMCASFMIRANNN